MNLPIVFIHTGYSSYLEFTLRQAKYANPESEIILLGDKSNDRFDFITRVDARKYYTTANEFESTYQHMSSNPYGYELFCFQRWFILCEYMKKKGIGEVFVCDSDILLYANMARIKEECFRDCDCTFMISAFTATDEESSSGVGYWKLKPMLGLCELMMRTYEDASQLAKYREYFNSVKIGGISDMTLTHKFYLLQKDNIRIGNLLEIKNNAVCDSNVNANYIRPNETYAYRYGAKQFSWKAKIPYCKNLDLNTTVKFQLIHFQGPAKYMISKYYTGNKFKGQLALSVKYAILNIMAYCYKTLKIRYRFAFLFKWFFSFRN